MSYTYREVALNWLALGLLLAAWNAADDAAAGAGAAPAATADAGASPAPQLQPIPLQRPSALQGYPHVSVRAATRAAVIGRSFTVM